ncbi:MAG: hypothetical protein ABR569_12970 [Gaiellaceae bacterium]
MSRTEILLWIVTLFVLEVNHLKWIWWENWNCRHCTRKHMDCACESTKWVMYL